MKNAYLVGERVYLRPLEQEDAALLASWFNDSQVTRTLLMNRPVSVEWERTFLANLYGPDKTNLILGVAVRETDRLIGTVGLRDVDARARHACFGIALGERAEWGKGYGSDATALIVKHAFEGMNLNRVWLLVHADHARAIRAYERAGFKREGLLRQHAYREGQYVDEVVMGVLRSEWSARPAIKADHP